MGTPTMAKALKMSGQVSRRAAQVREVARHHQDENQLHPLRRLKEHRPELDPAPATEGFMANAGNEDGSDGDEKDAVRPRNPVEQPMVVDLAKG